MATDYKPDWLTHSMTGSQSSWCHRCHTMCADRMYLRPDLGLCKCCREATDG